MHEAARSTGAWVVLLGILYTLLLWWISVVGHCGEHRPLTPSPEHVTAQAGHGEGLLGAGSGGVRGEEQEVLPRAWWPRLHPPASTPGAPLATSGSRGHEARRKQAVCGNVHSRVAIIKSLSQSLLAAS